MLNVLGKLSPAHKKPHATRSTYAKAFRVNLYNKIICITELPRTMFSYLYVHLPSPS